MPTSQPSNAPDALPADADSGESAAAVIADERMDTPPGGGGLGGAAAAGDPLRGAGGAARNAPIDVPTSEGDDDARAQREAAVQAADADTKEPHPSSL